MLVVNCPHCRADVLQNPDGSCPACGKPIPPEAMRPVIVQGAFGTSEDGHPHAGASGGPTSPHDPYGQYGQAAYAAAHHPIVQFQRQLLANTPRVYMTQVMVAINVAVFVLMVLSGTSPFNPDGDTLIAWGANYGSKTLSGEWWRLLTCMYLHGGVLHIGFNMWILWDVGKQAERLTGNVGFLLMYLLSGLFGSLASLYWNPAAFSVGASGAVFGVVGALMGFLLPRSDSVPKPFLASLKRSGFTFLFYNLIIGIFIPRIDMAAHVGGFVSGAVFGFIMSQPLSQVTAATRRIRNLAVVAAGMLGLAAALYFAPPPPADLHASLQDIGKAEEQLVGTYNETLQQFGNGQLSEQQFVSAVESQILQPWRAQRANFDQLNSDTLNTEQLAVVKKLGDYMLQREQRWQAVAAAVGNLARYSELGLKTVEFCNAEIDKKKTGEISDEDLAEAIETQVLPKWKELQTSLQQSDFSDLPEPVERLAQSKIRCMQLRKDAWEALVVALKIHDQDMLRVYEEKNRAAEEIAEQVKAEQAKMQPPP